MELIRQDIQGINSAADLLETERSRIPIDFVLDIQAYDVHDAESLAQQTEKIEHLSSGHAHHLSHVSLITHPHPLSWQNRLLLMFVNYRGYKQFAFTLMTSWIRLMNWRHGFKPCYGRSSGLDWRITAMKSLCCVSRVSSRRQRIQQKRASDWSFKASRTFTISKMVLSKKTVQPRMLRAKSSSLVKILLRTSCLHLSKSLYL